jgi:hypothetical protein
MSGIRRSLSWLAAAWLFGQAAMLAAAPVMTALNLDVDECCRHLGPGQTCPMHHPSAGDRTCKMRSACPRADFALVSIAGGAAILPGATDLVTNFEPGDGAASADESARSLARVPDPPPPRA